jgi:putative glutamine amidotransferase
MNVALGGSLWQRVHEVPGLRDHREDKQAPLEVQYGPAHEVHLAEGGWFRPWAEGAESIRVNSLHGQGVKRLASGLLIEAEAPDGLIEAFRVAESPAFAVGVQWHPEWRVMANSFSVAMFEAFGAAARSRAARRSVARG